jgi:hypothetical protein
MKASMAVLSLALAVLGHLNELSIHINESLHSRRLEDESETCKSDIAAFNKSGQRVGIAEGFSNCRESTLYHIERQFYKKHLTHADLELTGRGPFLHKDD